VIKVRISEDLHECQQVWQRYWPDACLFDLWPVRACFQRYFNYPPCLLLAECNGSLQGILALSWIEDEQCFGHFPGETWQGKTWLEQNKIFSGNAEIFKALLDHIPGPANIRYLTRESMALDEADLVVDEIGYLFFPKKYGYSFENYMHQFSGKSRKKLNREMAQLASLGFSVRHNSLEDIALLFGMNQEAFGEKSYFSDARFLNSFEDLLSWLLQKDLLRITTVLLGGKVAAVDVGAVWRSSYTVLAGGTHPDFPGVAKLINFHHLEWACQQRMEVVDFLCGSFGWKERFHLTPRPLYGVKISPELEVRQNFYAEERVAFAY